MFIKSLLAATVAGALAITAIEPAMSADQQSARDKARIMRAAKWKLSCLTELDATKAHKGRGIGIGEYTSTQPELDMSAAADRYGLITYKLIPSKKDNLSNQLKDLAGLFFGLSSNSEGSYVLAVEVVDEANNCIGSEILFSVAYKQKQFLFFTQQQQEISSEKLEGTLANFFEVGSGTNRLKVRLVVLYSKDRNFDPSAFKQVFKLGQDIQLLSVLPIPLAAQTIIGSIVNAASQITKVDADLKDMYQKEMAFLKEDTGGSGPPAKRIFKIPSKADDSSIMQLIVTFQSRGPKLLYDGQTSPHRLIHNLKVGIGTEATPVLDYLRTTGTVGVKDMLEAFDKFEGAKFEAIGRGCLMLEEAFIGFNNDLDANLAYYSFLHKYAAQLKDNPNKKQCYQAHHRADYERRKWVLPDI